VEGLTVQHCQQPEARKLIGSAIMQGLRLLLSCFSQVDYAA
jgi:hypothetical protein